MHYQTFDLTVSATSTPHEYLLSTQTSHHGETNAPIKTQIVASADTLANLFAELEANRISTVELQALGKKLYERLFIGEINLLLNRALGETIGHDDCGLRLRLRINPLELAALPWEFLYSPERRLFLAASVETPLSRYLNLPEPVRAIACPEKIRMLVVIPQNSDLDTAAEREMLRKIDAKLAGKLVIDFVESRATITAIRAALREKEYHIFHYAGHGVFKNDEAFLYLDHEEKLTEAISAAHFAQFFLDYPSMRLVVLNACQGATRSAHQALAGAAPQLVLRGVPAVIAMQYSITNDDAILFATEFYEELCSGREGGQIEMAISRARKALLQERPASAVFGNPALYLRAADGCLWEEQKPPMAEPQTKAKEGESLLSRWGRIGLNIGAHAIGSLLKELPVKMSEWQTIKGQIKDERGLPLPEVIVMLPEYGKKDTTDEMGVFRFQFDLLELSTKSRTKLQAIKEGYEHLNGSFWFKKRLGFNQFKMKKLL